MAKKKVKRKVPRRSVNSNDAPSRVSVDDLYFDAKNPRLVEYAEGKSPTQKDLLRILWQQMAVDELAMSIVASGYFDHEPLFVVKEGGRLVVIEGNRRLAAVKLLLDKEARQELRATDLPKISSAAARKLESLPVIHTTRKKAWQYVGFKHVNGPAKWESYAKAEYIAHVHDDFEVPLDGIARQIGDTNLTVQRLYRALMVVKQAERNNVFQRENRSKKHFAFSHLYTGLQYDGIGDFIGLRSEGRESQSPVPRSKYQELRELCTWLYGDRTHDKQPVVTSQNPDLRYLNSVLLSRDATESLRAGMSLEAAVDVSKGDDRLFHDALISGKDSLQKARATLSTGFHGEQDLIRLADDIAELAGDLAEEMNRKTSERRRTGRK